MSNYINLAPGILDRFIARHRWINSILNLIDVGQSNGLMSSLSCVVMTEEEIS